MTDIKEAQGLEVVGYLLAKGRTLSVWPANKDTDAPLCRLSDATAVIDQLRAELAAAPKAEQPVDQALMDAMTTGTGFTQVGADGSVKRIAPEEWREQPPVQEPVASFMKVIADSRIVFADDEGKPSDVLEYIEALIENPNPSKSVGCGSPAAFIWKDFTSGKQVVSIDRAPHGARPLYAAPQPSDDMAKERQRCVDIVETYKVRVGNSAAGEIACEMTMEALHEIRDAIKDGSKGDE